MKQKPFIMHYSLFVGLIGLMAANAADAAIRIGNASRNYAGAYQQVNAQRDYMAAQNAPVQTVADVAPELPVRVANADVAAQVARGDTNAPVAMSQLDQCARIYPDGEFAWDRPTLGTGAGGASTCVAVVEMRGYQMGPNGSDVLLARANLASGDTVKCNISEFPETSYTHDAENITFPMDAEPTVNDVVRVMNDEQKKNAGVKIAAATVIGALGGNMAGKNEVGQDSLLGTGKHKMQSTLVGALGGAAIGAGSAYAGKVGGDVILSTGVNAAAGGIVGNMSATGDSVLRIEDCKLPNGSKESCLWGMLVIGTPVKLSEDAVGDDGQPLSGDIQNAYFNIVDGKTIMLCDKNNEKCTEEELISVEINNRSLEAYQEKDFQAIQTNNDNKLAFHLARQADGTQKMEPGAGSGETATYAKITRANKPSKKISAAIAGVNDKAFGMKRSDWTKWKKDHGSRNVSALIYGRTGQGELYELENIGSYTLNDFYPMYIDAEDGGIIDLSNKARMKSTLIGAGAGGALGAFSGYQGAQNDINNRWVSAVREYKDSLQKVYCITGRRFLSYYNDVVFIPNMGE